MPSARSVPTPEAQVSVPTPRPLATTPSVQVGEAEAVPSPQVTATAEVPDQVAASTEETQTGDQEAQTETDAVGGNAPDTGQTQAQVDAQANNAGAAAAPEAATAPTGAPASRTPYEVSRSQPIAVMLDNALGYPQAGLLEASRHLRNARRGRLDAADERLRQPQQHAPRGGADSQRKGLLRSSGERDGRHARPRGRFA